jgi:hypothetical protein
MKKEAGCSIKECESWPDIVFCPNRFTGYEMLDIQVALEFILKDSDLVANLFKGRKSLIVSGETVYHNVAESPKFQLWG